MTENYSDTIAAVSTPRGRGGIAVIRISGGGAISVCERIFRAKNGRPISEQPSKTAVYGEIFDLAAAGSPPQFIDDVIVTIFRAPASYTGEDTAEISCHGGIFITGAVLRAVLTAGARAAGAGEFTRRAFVAGKIDLNRAEAIGGLLEAKNYEQLKLFGRASSDALSRRIGGEVGVLRSLLAEMYARIDFPDEDLGELHDSEIASALEKIHARLGGLAATYGTGRAVGEGIRTVICGRPNAGKSSLYNLLLGEDAAIVTDIEGTTRDVLESGATLGRVYLRLCDTAGLRGDFTKDSNTGRGSAEHIGSVERIGISRAIGEIRRAELILAVFDGSRPISDSDRMLIDEIGKCGGKPVALINKSDLTSGGGDVFPIDFLGDRFARIVKISAKTGEGFDELRETVERLFIDGSIVFGEDYGDGIGDGIGNSIGNSIGDTIAPDSINSSGNRAVIATARQYAAVVRARGHAEAAIAAVTAGHGTDMAAADIELAMSALAEITGRQASEEIVSEIFAKFCVGK